MADIDPPYRLDPLQNPVNVKWGGGAGEIIFGWFEAPVALGAPGISWIDSHVRNTTGDGAHEFAGVFDFDSIDDATDSILLAPVMDDLIKLHADYLTAYNNYILFGGDFPKIPYIKATLGGSE